MHLVQELNVGTVTELLLLLEQLTILLTSDVLPTKCKFL